MKANHDLDILFMGVKTMTNLVKYLPRYGTMLLHAYGIANILSLSKVAKNTGCDAIAQTGTNFLFIFLVEIFTVSNSFLEAYSNPI